MKTDGKTRRDFLKESVYFGAGLITAGSVDKVLGIASARRSRQMKFGLVTYLWGRDWDLPTLIANCEKTRILGVELRTTHKHGVEPHLTDEQRREVKKRFDDSPVTLVGLGSDERFDSPDADKLNKAIETTKAFIKLSRDVGGSGVKVKPNDLPDSVPREKTIEQIGKSLNILGAFGADYGQQIRLEVHGECSRLPIIREIMDVADHPNVAVCWNCNDEDLLGEGLEYNFNLVKDRLGDTVHIRELNIGDYPYHELVNLLVGTDYTGWVLLEARTHPKDCIKALKEQRKIWNKVVSKALSSRRTTGQENAGVEVIKLPDKLRVEVNKKLFTEYNFRDDKAAFPYFYPVIGPTGVNITRNWPMKEGENEEHDHPHHRSLWFTHGEVNGNDFWQGASEKIVHDEFIQISSGPEVGIIQSRNKWLGKDSQVVCTDMRTHKFYNRPDGQMMDFEITIYALNGDVFLGDTKEGSMALRLAPTMRVEGEVGQGHIINSEGLRDKRTWGKRAAWCDYYGPVNGEVVGVAIFDHPENPRHPTWWHVRTYGLFAANPFGVHYFERKPKGTGDLTVKAGESVTFRYRLYFHKGDEEQGKVAGYYREYAAAK